MKGSDVNVTTDSNLLLRSLAFSSAFTSRFQLSEPADDFVSRIDAIDQMPVDETEMGSECNQLVGTCAE